MYVKDFEIRWSDLDANRHVENDLKDERLPTGTRLQRVLNRHKHL